MKILHNGFNPMTKIVLCLKLIRDFGKGRTFPDLPLRSRLRENFMDLRLLLGSGIHFLLFNPGIQMDVDTGNHSKERISFFTVDFHIM